MPAAGLLDIKRRIKSVQSTQKITKAMALVSTSKLRRARANLENNNLYFSSLENIKQDMLKVAEEFSENEYVHENDAENKLYVIFASNSGLCGGFNGSGALYLNDKYPRDQRGNIKTLIIGEKGVSYAKKYNFEIVDKITGIKDGIELKDARHIALDLMESYLKGEYKEVSFVYTKYVSPIQQEVVEERLLPFNAEIEDEKEPDGMELLFDVEVSSDELIQSFVYRYMEGKIINVIYHSQTSEQNARMQAMDGASKNADDILEELNMRYNRIRQGAITQEISEIVGGAEAQK
ncbi:ATP synthase F1 subunit gamma [uncultured Clostridium sp.]|uniref:ATP synthase F1 subunit gamma n=1 Tax=uncultured Clostridium sp. TaxID=59620 RepID=UPI0026065718|nr:ATP synthase F1 subunit gamma [uncultured Clostridium sp.]